MAEKSNQILFVRVTPEIKLQVKKTIDNSMPVINNNVNSKQTKQNNKKIFNESTYAKKDHFIWAKCFKLTKK